MRTATRLAALAAFFTALLLPSPAVAGVRAGYDLFATDPASTHFSFQAFPIPANFFAPGSAPFTGTIELAGEPLGRFMGFNVGDADTVVQRQMDASLPTNGSTATVPIQLLELSLMSTAPIMVQVGNATQQWDVQVDLSQARPSQGTMTIMRTSSQGGTFDSQFTVYPRFTFTMGDQVRILDVGELLPPSAPTTPLELRAKNVPWRAGCVYPALAVKALNAGFCPGLTTGREKVLTVEQAQLAQHGVYPAQPPTDHFKCYDITAPRFRQRTVQLTDQFGLVAATVRRPTRLCNPVQKNNEPIRNPAAHLKCYPIVVQPSFVSRQVIVRNQFGDQILTVVKPLRLCVPSTKKLLEGPGRDLPKGKPKQLTDHYQCYEVTGTVAQRTVSLADQFHIERVNVLRPVELCVPARKNEERFLHPLHHLTCYEIENVTPRKFKPRVVRVTNQFGVEILTVRKPRTLCVPSQKFPFQPPPPPPEEPPCDGTITLVADVFRFEFTCDLTDVNGFALVVPAQITNFQPPPGLNCGLLSTGSPNNTLVCAGPIPPNTPVQGLIHTDPPLQPGQNGQLYVNQGMVQLGPFNLPVQPQVPGRPAP